MPKRVSVILATYGEVEDPKIRTLLPNSKRILRYITTRIARIPRPVVELIAWMRSFKRKKYWNSVGYRSRLNAITRSQTQALTTALKSLARHDVTFEVREAFYFVPPYMESVLKEVSTADAVIVVPMIPVESDFSCGVGCVITEETYGANAFGKVAVPKHLWNDDALIEVYCNHIFNHAGDYSTARKTGLALAVHGTLVKGTDGLPPKSNTGYRETLAFFEKVKAAVERDPRNAFSSVKLGCLNHEFGGEWTPETLSLALEEFKSESVEQVAVFPFGFFADNSEADLEAVEETERAGFSGVKMRYIPCVNDSPEFMAWLAGRVSQSSDFVLGLQERLSRLTPVAS